MLKMGVKKKHEHESGFFEENLISESAKSSRSEWMSTYRNQQQHRNTPTTQQINGTESNHSHHSNKPMELHDVSRGNKNYNNYLGKYDREMMNASGDSKSNKSNKHSNSNRNRGLNQNQSSSNSANIGDNPIVISDDEDNCDDYRSQNTHTQYYNGMHQKNYINSYANANANIFMVILLIIFRECIHNEKQWPSQQTGIRRNC